MVAKKAVARTAVLILAGGLALSGCGGAEGVGGNGEENATEANVYNNEPVRLTLYSHNAGFVSDADLETLVTRPVQAKYPNITVELIDGKSTNLDKMIAAGESPDIIATSNYYLYEVLEKGLGTDLNEMIKSHNLDLGKFEPTAVNEMKKFGKNGEMFGIPYAMNYGVMIYNKDIFDRFGVPYPTDNMTWEQVIDLGRRVTRADQGVQYIGLDPGSPQSLSRAYSLPVVDERQEKAVLNSEPYKMIFNLLKQVYDIPGTVDSQKKYAYGIDYVLKEQKLAMHPYWLAALTSRLPQLNESGKNFNWDIVSYPSFKDKPGIGREIDFHLAMVPPGSKHKEAAYAVIATMASEEAQRAMNRGTRLTVLNNAELRNEFAMDTKLYEGKNLQGVFKVKPAPLPEATPYDVKLYSFLGEGIKSMINEGKDINTVLREANEKADKHIEEMKKQE